MLLVRFTRSRPDLKPNRRIKPRSWLRFMMTLGFSVLVFLPSLPLEVSSQQSQVITDSEEILSSKADPLLQTVWRAALADRVAERGGLRLQTTKTPSQGPSSEVDTLANIASVERLDDGTVKVSLTVRLTGNSVAELKSAGFAVGARAGDVATVETDVARLPELAALASVRRMSAATYSYPTNDLARIGTTANVTIQDNETANGSNPIDNVDFFIRQNYIDFLGREPDPAGLAGWRNVLVNCGTTVQPPCDRIEVSAGFFRSEEFQTRGYFIYRFYSSVGRIPLSNEFYPDFGKVSGFLIAGQLEGNKVAFVNEFMTRGEFQAKYSSTFDNPTAYVDELLQSVELPGHPSRDGWIAGLTSSSLTRAQVLRQLVESSEVFTRYYNEAFVIMQYFGYLRRTADASYLSWIQTMTTTGGDYRIMINGFMNSSEYRRRFGP